MLLVIHFLVVGLFVILGIVFSRGKGASLIAGYNTSSAAEKAKTDEKKLCKAMSKLMFALAGCWLVAASSEIFGMKALLWIGMAMFVVVITAALVYMNTGNRFDR